MALDVLLHFAPSQLDAVDRAFGVIVGADGAGSHYGVARWVFLRCLGVIYLIAFFSLWTQVDGLIGRRGILPVETYLAQVRSRFGRRRYHLVPTLLWLRADDAALHAICASGVIASLLLIVGVAPAVCLVALWILYLSLNAVGRDFLAFQWDALLLEAGLLAIFIAPWRLVPGTAPATPNLALFLLWWLLFRLTFQSGVVKLTSGDPTWRRLRALDYHYFTQPLPTAISWYAHWLPRAVHRFSVAATYVLEIAVPLLIFGTRDMRLIACGATIFLQLLILTTGNYNFFNFLTIALALLLLDDRVWTSVLSEPVIEAVGPPDGSPPSAQLALLLPIGVLWLGLGAVRVWQALVPGMRVPAWVSAVMGLLEPLRSLNSYGLFRVMTTRRPEIVVEASDDGSVWHEYEFHYKPGDVRRAPPFVEPHQPRLDWQMWFAALSRFEATPWFHVFLARLLEGSPAVLRLLARAPFGTRAPRYVRALYYDYRFTTPEERRRSGAWWSRRLLGAYAPVLTHAPGPRGAPAAGLS